jgi:hypothetical protein
MADSTVLVATFQDIDRTADALDGLRDLGISDRDITVMSSVPYSPEMLGRPHYKTRLPIISFVSALAGFLVGVFYTVGTPNLYPLMVGGQPFVPGPPTALLLYEFTMLFLILGTFLGILWINMFPSYGPQYYNKKLTDGRIALEIHCGPDQIEASRAVLEAQKAEEIEEPERRPL